MYYLSSEISFALICEIYSHSMVASIMIYEHFYYSIAFEPQFKSYSQINSSRV